MGAEGDFAPFEEKMRAEGLSDAAIDAFRHNYEQLVAGATGLVSCAGAACCAIDLHHAAAVTATSGCTISSVLPWNLCIPCKGRRRHHRGHR